ncbi:hypothetical protein Tco_1389379 [Tanacetum coccineum]
MEESLSKFMTESTKRHDENSSLINEIQASTDAAIRNQGTLIKAFLIQIGQMSKVLQEMGSGSLLSSTETNPKDHVKSISTAKKDDIPLIHCLGKLAPTKLIIELADKTVKRPKGIAENVFVGIDKSQDYEFGDFLELNDLNEPLELRNLENEDLGPIIEEGEIVDEPMVDVVIIRYDEYPNFTVIENMDAYRDKDMGDIIFGKLFCKDACVEARWFDRFITSHNGNDNVTYQIARSHPRFKHLSNKQCNKIRPLLKVSARDKLNGILHPYQKLKGFYKGVLNLGPEYIRDEEMFEWLTCGHVSVHEMD